MNVLPVAIANGRNHIGTIAGKLNGVIAAHTPTGWRIVSASTFVATPSRVRPCIVVGIAQAHSTISIMRSTSARASGNVLPISAVTHSARRSLCSSSCWRNPNSQRARSIVLFAFQAGKAARAACTAWSTSLAPDSGTCESTAPVAGFCTSRSSLEADGTHAPLM